jgi:hypothetical protein
MEWNGEEALAISRGVYKWSGNLWRELELVNGDDIKETREGEMHGFCCWGYMPQLLSAHQTPFSSRLQSSLLQQSALAFLCSSGQNS